MRPNFFANKQVMHHRRRSLSPSAYLGFLVSILTASADVRSPGGAKRTARHRVEGVVAGGSGGGGGGKRRRQRSAASVGGGRPEDAEEAEAETAAVPPAPPTLWETVFGRDEVTGAVCNSLAMIGTRGGALLEALQPTLLQLLRHRSIRGVGGGGRGGGSREKKLGTAGGDVGDDVTVMRSLDDATLAAVLQGQRAAMACVLCCWEGLGAGAESPSPKTKADDDAGGRAASPLSPLFALERPVAAACVWAMKTAGTAEAGEKARGARLLRPVLVLVKRWPAILPLMLTLIVGAASKVTAAAVAGEGGGAMHDGVVGVGGFQSLGPVLRCLQAVVRNPALQGQLRRRHVGVLRETAKTLCVELSGSPLKDVVVQLRADVHVLGGGGGLEDVPC